jgi:hypothetical protein
MKKAWRTSVASGELALARAAATVTHPSQEPVPVPWQPSPQPWQPVVVIIPIRQF